MNEKELKTRSELMAELEKVCDAMRPYFSRATVFEEGDRLKIATHSFSTDKGGELIVSPAFSEPQQYRNDPVPPAKWEPVFVITKKSGLCIRVSRGCFDIYGRLKCFSELAPNGYIPWEHWCCVNNRDHHSTGWNKEWEPKE